LRELGGVAVSQTYRPPNEMSHPRWARCPSVRTSQVRSVISSPGRAFGMVSSCRIRIVRGHRNQAASDGFAVAGSSLDRHKVAAIPAISAIANVRARTPAEILARGPSRAPDAAAQTTIISVARIRLDSRKFARPFKGIFCADISEFESYMLSHAVWSLWAMYSCVPEGPSALRTTLLSCPTQRAFL
jgi:hypothetical protein